MSFVLPAEADDALDALRAARERVGDAVDALRQSGAPLSASEPFVHAQDAVAWSVEIVSGYIASASSRARMDREMLDVEERHVDGQMFPWTEDR